jgi:hypothetical protein
MSSGAGKNDSFIAKIINHNPIVFNMTFGKTAVIA